MMKTLGLVIVCGLAGIGLWFWQSADRSASAQPFDAPRVSPDVLPDMSFDRIRQAGLENACYPDTDHHVAEFLYQHPDACFWTLDVAGERVSALPVPSPPADAVRLPAPSGRDDTAMIQRVVDANPGGAIVGQGVYRVEGLHLAEPIDIFDMPMIVASANTADGGSGVVVVIDAPDVRLFDSPVNAAGSPSVHTGYQVRSGADRFTLVGGGFLDALHRDGRNVAGVTVRGADDIHLACNRFERIVNDTDDSTLTARANAILLNGGGEDTISGGIIANNTALEHQSNGKRQDAEFLTIQSYAATDAAQPLRVFANRTVDAGKRFTKHQQSDALVLSNDTEWRDKAGPLGDRKLQAHVEIQFSDNVIARNNRMKVGADSRFDYLFTTDVHVGDRRQSNVHYDCNDIEVTDALDPASGNKPHVIVARASRQPRGSVDRVASGSSANGNRVHGEGSVSHHFWFGEGYPDDGGEFEHRDNLFDIPALKGAFKTP